MWSKTTPRGPSGPSKGPDGVPQANSRTNSYDHWNRPGKTTFHSTTYQPNTIASLHFLRRLEHDDPEFHASVAADLERVQADLRYRREVFRRRYSPSLYKVIRMTGCLTADVRAAGAFVWVGGRKVFDGVSGVACSIRGHNPPGYAVEVEGQGGWRSAGRRWRGGCGG